MNEDRNNQKRASKSVTFMVRGTHQLQPDIKTIHVIIEKGKQGYYAYAVNVEGITGEGDSIKVCQGDVMNCIEDIKSSGEKDVPDILNGKYEIVYQVKADQTIN